MGKKQPVKAEWYDQFGIKEIKWLLDMGIRAEKIVDYGCWQGEEVFQLLWTFDATEIRVVEINENHLTNLDNNMILLKLRCPDSLEGRYIKSINADMSLPIPELPIDYFDLGFCSNVLYFMEQDYEQIQRAINEMAKAIRSGGYIVAHEPKMGVEYELAEGSLLLPIPLNDPVNISHLFVAAGLIAKPSPYYHLYVYQKP